MYLRIAFGTRTQLMIAYRIGDCDISNCVRFIQNMCDRLANRIQLTTDGLTPYRYAVEKAFPRARVDFAQLVKQYGPGAERAGKNSLATGVGTETRWVMSQPEESKDLTSYIERQNFDREDAESPLHEVDQCILQAGRAPPFTPSRSTTCIAITAVPHDTDQ